VSSQQPIDQTVRTALYPALVIRNRQPGEIDLTEVGEIELDGDGEEEVDYDGSDLEEYEDDEDNESRFEEEYSYSVSSEADPEPGIRPRKRSSDVLQEEEEEEDTPDTNTSDSPSLRRHETGATPPKRARIGDSDFEHDNNATLTIRTIPSPVRPKKRSSEELEEGDVATGTKRPKLDKSPPVFHSPISLEADKYENSLPSTVDEDEDSCNHPLARGPILHRRISKADIDKLIPLDDLED